MTHRIPPVKIGTSTSEVRKSGHVNMRKDKEKKLEGALSWGVGYDYMISDPIEVKQLYALQNGKKINIKIDRPKNEEIKWEGNVGYIKEKFETDEYTEFKEFKYQKDKKNKVELLECKATYRSKLSQTNVKTYFDRNGDFKIDESAEFWGNTIVNDTDFDGLPNNEIVRNADGSITQKKYNKKYNIFE